MVGQQQVRHGDASSEEPVAVLLPQDTFVCLHASMHTELADQHDKLHLLRFPYIILILKHRKGNKPRADASSPAALGEPSKL